MKTINLEELTESGRVHNLSGRLRGLAAREHFDFDAIDKGDEPAEVQVPGHVYSLTPSFVQGLFGESVKAAGGDVKRFREKFHFVAPPVVLKQLDRGFSAILTDRDLSSLR